MEVHRQQCQACGSFSLYDVLVREAGQPQTVFVICAACHDLVARYRLQGYYHHGKGADSFIRSREGKMAESGRELLEEFDTVRVDALRGFKRVLGQLADLHKPLEPAGFPTAADVANVHAEGAD
ncbi:MAG: hypothetical protein R3B49_00145 [Phycisphaerales bacterium]